MEWFPGFLVPFLFRQSHRDNRVDGPAAEVFRVGEEVPDERRPESVVKVSKASVATRTSPKT